VLELLLFGCASSHCKQVEDDIATYFNQLLDDLRSSEEQKNASLKQLFQMCEHNIREIDAVGAKLQSAPYTAATLTAPASEAKDSQTLTNELQKVLARPFPTVNAAKFVSVPNPLADLLARANQHDELCEQVDRQGQQLDRTLEEKEEVSGMNGFRTRATSCCIPLLLAVDLHDVSLNRLNLHNSAQHRTSTYSKNKGVCKRGRASVEWCSWRPCTR